MTEPDSDHNYLSRIGKAAQNVFFGFLLVMPLLAFGTDVGDLCVSDVATNPKYQISLIEGTKPTPLRYEVQIGDGVKSKLSENSSTYFAELALNEKHLVKVYRQGQIVQSFWHKFDGHKSYCLWYHSLYQSWSMWPGEDSNHLCDCGSAKTQSVQNISKE